MKIYQLLALTFLLSCTNSDSEIEPSSFEVISPEEAGLTHQFVDGLVNDAAELPNIYSFVVLKNGKLLTENYFNGKNRNSLLHIRSITKSVSSLLIGQLISTTKLSEDDYIEPYFTNYWQDSKHPYSDQIQLRHLLDMTSGFEWDESANAIQWYTQISDTWGFFFDHATAYPPNTYWNYNSGGVSLLAKVIGETAQMDCLKYADQVLFTPLEIEEYTWERDGLGNIRTDAGLQLKALNLAKIGLVVMNQGRFDDNQVLDSQWIAESWNPKIRLSGSMGPITSLAYNNLWWIGEYRELSVYFGLGYGGQLLLCVPSLDLVVVANHNFELNPNVANTHSEKFLTAIFKPLLDELID
ncbi:serine hydrolase domain-containing protein [Fulvivirga lutea]|uniref:Serine hydrolase n=1 Tax=Fulvivirga lutea TaxID=2810512 RepID=A0A974WF88_9BACT|nr:serine hydrolase [Fulvivirga lutea]QSE97379.1 serine hydrolase [Fulvivirga lutea]